MTLFQPLRGKSADRLDVIEALRLLPERLREEVEGLDEAQLRFRPGDGQWSIKEVIGHLRDFVEIDYDRLARMIAQESPLLLDYDQETLVREGNYQEADVREVLGELANFREQTVRVLTELVDANWARQGRHEETGRISIRQFVDQWAQHEAMHLEHIRALKRQAGA